jgi:transposase-like protein/IS1 family transposase
MVLTPVKCPHCGSENVVKNGTAENGRQRFLCRNENCAHRTFLEIYTHRGYDPEVRQRIFFLAVNGTGMRATARALGISKGTVTSALRNIKPLLWHINHDYINTRKNSSITVKVASVNQTEMDEIWISTGYKSLPYRLWWAIDHNTGEPLAFRFGARDRNNMDELTALLEPFGIKPVYSGNNSHVTESGVVTGRQNTQTQTAEGKHPPLRMWCSRLIRKGLHFSEES